MKNEGGYFFHSHIFKIPHQRTWYDVWTLFTALNKTLIMFSCMFLKHEPIPFHYFTSAFW